MTSAFETTCVMPMVRALSPRAAAMRAEATFSNTAWPVGFSGCFLVKELLYQAETRQFFPRKLYHRIGYHRCGGTGDKADYTEFTDAGEADGYRFNASTPLH